MKRLMRFIKPAPFAVMVVLFALPAFAQEPLPVCDAEPNMASFVTFDSLAELTTPSTAIIDAYVESIFPESAIAGRSPRPGGGVLTETDVVFRILSVLKGPSNLQQVVVSFAREGVFEPRHCGEQLLPGQRYILFLQNPAPERLAVLPSRGAPRYAVVRSYHGMFGVVDGAMRLDAVANNLREKIERMTFDEVVAAIRAGVLPTLRDVSVRAVVEGGGSIPRISFSLRKPTGNIEISKSGDDRNGAPRFRFPEGEQRIVFSAPLPSGYSLKSLTAGGTDLLRQPLTVTDKTPEIVATFATAPNATRRVSGRVAGFDAFWASLTPTLRANNPEITLSGTGLATDLYAPVRTDGTFEFGALAQGAYIAQFSAGVRASERIPIVVSDRNIVNLEIAISTAGRGSGAPPINAPQRLAVTGRIVVEGMPSGHVPFYSVATGGPVRGPRTGIVLSSETFTTTLIEPVAGAGFKVSVTAPGYEVKSIMMGARNLTETPLRLQDAPLGEIVVTLRPQPPATKPLP
jgi:hypothetical protein